MLLPLLILASDTLLLAITSVSANQPYNVNSNLLYRDDRERNYRNFKLIRINPKNKENLTYLKHLYQNSSPYELDFWQPPSHVGALVDVTVSPEDAQIFVHDLESKHIEFIVAISDLQQAIESERSGGVGREAFSDGSFQLDKYNRLSEIEEYLRKLKEDNLKMITLTEIGKSHENRSITVVKLSGKRSFGTNVSIWIDAGIHAREWIAPAVALSIIDELISGYSRDPVIQNLMDSIDWYILPVVNPDGYEYTHTKNRMWRKNRRPAQCKRNYFHTVCCAGVDLNRNFDWFWASTGSSTDPCHETYHGPSAFSEPETQAVKNFLEKLKPEAFLTLHSYSQMWLIPYGHRKRSYPQDYSTALKPLAIRATKALQKVHGTRYGIGTGADLMYEASGGSHDWAKGHLHVPYSYLIELRPKNTMFGNGFLLPEREIRPTAEETFEAVKVVADELLGQFAQPKIREMLLSKISTTNIPEIEETASTPKPKGAEIPAVGTTVPSGATKSIETDMITLAASSARTTTEVSSTPTIELNVKVMNATTALPLIDKNGSSAKYLFTASSSSSQSVATTEPTMITTTSILSTSTTAVSLTSETTTIAVTTSTPTTATTSISFTPSTATTTTTASPSTASATTTVASTSTTSEYIITTTTISSIVPDTTTLPNITDTNSTVKITPTIKLNTTNSSSSSGIISTLLTTIEASSSMTSTTTITTTELAITTTSASIPAVTTTVATSTVYISVTIGSSTPTSISEVPTTINALEITSNLSTVGNKITEEQTTIGSSLVTDAAVEKNVISSTTTASETTENEITTSEAETTVKNFTTTTETTVYPSKTSKSTLSTIVTIPTLFPTIPTLPPGVTNSTVLKCTDYGVYCKWWKIHDLCRLPRVQMLCSLSCNVKCRQQNIVINKKL